MTRIKQTVAGVLRDEFGIRILHDVVSGEREQIMSRVREKVDQDLERIGVKIIDVRLKRVDLPQDVSESVYRRMEAERKRIANELRSTGAAEAEKIRADADRQREGVLPFLAPSLWRDTFRRITQLSDGQIRFFGLSSMLLGLLILLALR